MGARPDRALARCVGDPARFTTEIFGRRHHLQRGADPGGYADLLSLAAVDDILATRSLRAPSFRVVRDGETLPRGDYTRTGTIGGRSVSDLPDVGRVHDLFADGATIVLQGLHRWWTPVRRLCRDLELALTHPVQANAYVTPPSAAGLDVHHDTHDVLALQVHGTKRWVLYPPVIEDPLPDQAWTGTADEVGEARLDTSLRPGDCLYVPRGTPHAAHAVGTASIHLTVGIRAVTWHDVARRAVRAAGDDAALRGALAPGFAHDRDGFAADVADRLRALADRIAGLDPGGLADAVIDDLWSGRRPLLEGQLPQLLRLDDIDDDVTVTRRPRAVARLRGDGDRLQLLLGDRRVDLPGRAEPAVRRLLEADRLPVGALSDLLDRSGRRVLVRRLVREGLLVAHHDAAGGRRTGPPGRGGRGGARGGGASGSGTSGSGSGT